MSDIPEISAVVPVVTLHDDTGALVHDYIKSLEATGKAFEIIYVLDGRHDRMLEELSSYAKEEPRLRVVQLARTFGEASALTAGFAQSSGDIILTLPAYYQVETSDIGRVIEEVARCDLAVATRTTEGSRGSTFKALRRSAFHWLVRLATRQGFSDLGCGVRAFKRNVVDELPIYGDQYRFFALLVSRRGFRVKEVQVRESTKNLLSDRHGPRVYLARLLDIFAIVFLTRFTKKPLRFFGAIGTVIFAFGGVVLLYLIGQRLLMGVSLADRPALLITSLMVVLGLQIFALGLLGELIIFTHAKDMKEYHIEKIVN